jgi:hypothetical protein
VWAGRDSVVGIATRYGLKVEGSNPGRDEILRPVQIGCGAHPASYTMGTVFRKSRAIPMLSFWNVMARSKLECTFTFTTSSVDLIIVFLIVVYFKTLFVSETAWHLKVG